MRDPSSAAGRAVPPYGWRPPGSRWRGRISLAWVDASRWRLRQDLGFHSTPLGWVTVPAGFETDLISLPGIGRLAFRTDGAELPAALIHDYLYTAVGRDDFPMLTRQRADRVFLEAMTDLDVPPWRRAVMYLAVRAFGGSAYREV